MFTIILGLPVVIISPTYDAQNPFRGFNGSVIALAFNNACGGLLVALIVKYGDNIIKGFSNALSTVLATIISVPLFGFTTGPSFVLGVFLVIWSSLVYGKIFKFSGDWWNTELKMSWLQAPKNPDKDEDTSDDNGFPLKELESGKEKGANGIKL